MLVYLQMNIWIYMYTEPPIFCDEFPTFFLLLDP